MSPTTASSPSTPILDDGFLDFLDPSILRPFVPGVEAPYTGLLDGWPTAVENVPNPLEPDDALLHERINLLATALSYLSLIHI